MKAYCAAVFMALVVSSQCSNCHWGPSYWCKSQSNAEECDTVQYCQENVWKGPKNFEETVAKVKAPQGLECDVCEEVMKFVGGELTKNATEAQVKNALLSFCNSTGPLASPCVSFVNQYFDQIWQLLVTDGLDPDKVCGELGLCTSAQSKPRPLKMAKVMGPNPVSCTVCEMVAKEIINMVENNATMAEAEVEVKKVCPYLAALAGECRSLIDDLFPELWKAAMTFVGEPKELCQKLNLCSSTLTTVKVGAGLCDLCNLAVSFLKPYVDSNTTEEEVKDAVMKLCSLLPGNASSECSTLVGTYFDLIWDLLKQEVDSGDICNQLGFCNKTAKVETFLIKPRPQPRLQSSVGDTLCDLCQLAVNFLKPYVDSNTTEQEVKAALEQVCGYLPSGLKDECSSLVDTYFDMIWALLKTEVDSGMICKQIGLCPNATKILEKKVESGGSTLCSTCKKVVSYVRTLVDSNITEALAKDAVEQLCKKAGPLAGECKTLVDQYFPMIWMLVQSYADDDQICSEIKLCSAPSLVMVQAKKPEASKVESGPLCLVCEYVMKELISMLDTNATKQDIEDALDKVCDLLPSSISDECTSFVDKYGSEIIDLILSGTAAKGVCAALHLCLLEEETVQEVETVEQELKGEKECEICKAILETVKTIIALKGGDAAKALDEVCKAVPSGLRSECTDFIDQYGPQLIQLLDKAIDPEAICKEIKLCSATKAMMY